ncbi:Pex2 / Pex12 amino terminal region [Rhizoctonia solani]|uniref:RING-type E3 ubiquitin transferase (cysteine targeting) n=1 Tax=Rhizoctonia solani TaxID=456999 RepID=A0A8H7IHV7_9AGAM|nr:Pex2 / Pex12 amino terminal region [Rhizoctonia solani]
MSTTIPDFWRKAWDAAQPRLDALRQSPTRSPLPRPLRVGQLDSEQLDSELLIILKEPLTKGLDILKGSPLLLFRMEYGSNVWRKAPKSQISGFAKGLVQQWQQSTIWFASSVALVTRWPNNAPSSDKRRRTWEALSHVESLHGVLSLASFIIFLWKGRYRTLADRLFGLRLEPIKRQLSRSVNYDFMNRQMVWHAFTEFLLFLLPLIDTKNLKRRLLHASANLQPLSLVPSYFRPMLGIKEDSPAIEKELRGPYWSLSTSECAICTEEAATTVAHMIAPDASERRQELAASEKWMPEAAPTHPLNTPYITSCGHVYCYVCVADRMLRAADDGGELWECLRCTAPVLRIHRADSDTPGFDDPRSRTIASESFDMDGSSLIDFDSDAISSTSPLSDSD